MKKILFSLLIALFIVGCGNKAEQGEKISNSITGAEAREMITEGALLLDVRTESEYNEEHIEGAVLLSLDDINLINMEDIVDTKDTVIIVYCRSGNRSSQAATKLQKLGYTNVYDLGRRIYGKVKSLFY